MRTLRHRPSPKRRRAAAGEGEARPVQAKPPAPSELERIESSIEQREAELAELERKLAEDWGDVDTLAAHRAARDDLRSLLARWEELFDAAQA